jgi:hypothetical protein
MKYIMEYPKNTKEVKIAKNVYDLMKKHELYMMRKQQGLLCIPESILLQERQEESEMTVAILKEIEKLLRVKKLLCE